MTIGEQIKKRRLELGYSVEDVAEMLGKNRATIYRYENNEIENLPANVLEPLAKVLQTTPAHLMGWEDNHTFNTDISTEPVEREESELVYLARKGDVELTEEQKRNIIRYINFVFDEEKE